MPDRIYLDHAATTPMRPEAIAAVEEGMRRWANPSSPHAEGRAARAALEDARARIKAALGWDGELIFTSGASEALAIGLGRAKAERRLVSAVEHDAVFRAAPDAMPLPIRDGEPDLDALAAGLAFSGRPIVAVQSLNSETGTLLLPGDGRPIVDKVREAGGLILSDCAQSAGKMRLPDADLVTVSAHKLGGPPGIGALLVRDFAMLEPSGGQEFGYRSGTENLPAILGFAAALDAAAGMDDWGDGGDDFAQDALVAMFDLKNRMSDRDAVPLHRPVSSALILPLAMSGVSAAAQLIQFDRRGFAVSVGSACSSGSLKPSRTLLAFGVQPEVAAQTIRVSFGWTTTVAEITAFEQAWLEIADEAKARA